jgi:hypothetical protein
MGMAVSIMLISKFSNLISLPLTLAKMLSSIKEGNRMPPLIPIIWIENCLPIIVSNNRIPKGIKIMA